MDLAISAVTGDLAGRFISFLMNKCSDHLCSKEKVERLQQLLLRVHTVIEEADGRYITNSCMLVQLKTLSAAMYQGYHVLDNIKYRQHKKLVSESFALSSVYAPPKRSRTATCTSSSTNKAFNSELQSALRNLEAAVANMVEFVVLLGGCERVSRRPYDAYLQVDNFMFGRHVEKQQIIGFLLRHDVPGPPAVLPVTGGRGVGKKTLVAHICNDERVRSHFATILHLKGDDLSRIVDHERLSGRTLLVVEFVSDVDGDDWTEFYSSVRSKGRSRCKVIIFGRDEKLKKFGTVEPVSVSRLPFEEYRYLFKTLALGSANPADHPRLAEIVEEFAILLGGGSLISANLFAHAMRKNPDAQFWLCTLNIVRTTVELNMSRFGVHPNELFDRGRPTHLDHKGHYLMSPGAPSPCPSARCNASGKNLPRVKWDLLAEAGGVPPKRDFELISWESRLPPYTSFVHSVRYVPSCVDDKPETSLSGKKRPGLSA